MAAAVCVFLGAVGGAAARLDSFPAGMVDVRVSLPYDGEVGFGTGIVLTVDGEVLTNNHVIRGATAIRVRDIDDGRVYSARVVGYDVSADVALLQLRDATGLRTAVLGDSASVRIGEPVTAYGNAYGLGGKPSSASGTVVAENEAITEFFDDGGRQPLRDLFATDAALRPGDSGGPLVGSGGRTIGIDTAGGVAFKLGVAENRGVAIPINRARVIAAEIARGRSSETIHVGPTAFLGVSFQPSAVSGHSPGLTVVSVAAESPAAEAGLKPGDVLGSLNGHLLDGANELLAVMERVKPGDAVSLGWTDLTGLPHKATVVSAAGPPQ